jgi:hypothetical protein
MNAAAMSTQTQFWLSQFIEFSLQRVSDCSLPAHAARRCGRCWMHLQ